jgi:tight adherence protein B
VKIIYALFLFAAAAILVYYNRVIRLYILSKINDYKSGVNSIIKSSITGIKTSAIIRLEISVALLTAFFVMLTGQWLLIIFGAPIMLVIPKMYAVNERKKYISQYYAGLTGFLESVISGLKAGLSVVAAFQQIAARDKGPIGMEISQVLKKVGLGKSLQEALLELAEKIPLKENEIVVSAVNTAMETGGNITEVLSNILDTIRKREELGREVKSLTSQGVLSGIIVGLLPVFMIVVISFMDPSYIEPLFNTGIGLAALAAAVVMEITGAVVIARIVDVK